MILKMIIISKAISFTIWKLPIFLYIICQAILRCILERFDTLNSIINLQNMLNLGFPLSRTVWHLYVQDCYCLCFYLHLLIYKMILVVCCFASHFVLVILVLLYEGLLFDEPKNRFLNITTIQNILCDWYFS